jgi:hypothetical protein
VYVLVDPKTTANRYVGVSSNGIGRPKQHALASVLKHNYNKRKDNWIRELQREGLKYAIRVLQYFETPEEAHAAEPYWIHFLRSLGDHLYNATRGDDTQVKASEETKAKMSRALTGRVITWGDKISAAKRGVRRALSTNALTVMNALLNKDWLSVMDISKSSRGILQEFLKRGFIERRREQQEIGRGVWRYKIAPLGRAEAGKLQ